MGVDVVRNTVYDRIKRPLWGRFFHALPSVGGPANMDAVPDMKCRGRVVQ